MSLLSERILKEVGPTAPFYAVLDGARSSSVAPWAQATRAPVWCLYEGKLDKALEEVAPRLIRLGRGHGFTEELLAEGFQEHWGIVFASDASSKDLRRHLRRFFLARTEDDRRLLFRYYDPRVLSLYLPALDAEELKTFFGPISMFITNDQQDGDPLAFETYRRRGTELVQKRIVIEPPAIVEPGAQKTG